MLTVITLEKSLLPYITANIPNTPMQHGYKTQHYTVTALHTLNNTVTKGFNQMVPPARTITVALDMSKAFDTINIHTLIRKLLQTNIPGTIIKFIANYIKGRKAYTTYRITHPNNVNLKLAFHNVASFHPHYSIFTPQTYHHPVHRFRSWPMQMTSQSHPHTHTRMSLNCAPTRVCRKSTPRPGYVVKVRPDPGYVVKQCPRIVMNKIFDWH